MNPLPPPGLASAVAAVVTPLSRGIAQAAIIAAENEGLQAVMFSVRETAASAVSVISKGSPPWSFDVLIPEMSAMASEALKRSADGCSRQAAAAGRLAQTAASAATSRLRRSAAASASVVKERFQLFVAQDGQTGEKQVRRQADTQRPHGIGDDKHRRTTVEVAGGRVDGRPGDVPVIDRGEEAELESGDGGDGRDGGGARSRAGQRGKGGSAGHYLHDDDVREGSQSLYEGEWTPRDGLGTLASATTADSHGSNSRDLRHEDDDNRHQAGASSSSSSSGVRSPIDCFLSDSDCNSGSHAASTAASGSSSSSSSSSSGAEMSAAEALANLQSPIRVPSRQAGHAVSMMSAEAGYRHQFGAAQWEGTVADTAEYIMAVGDIEGEGGGRGMGRHMHAPPAATTDPPLNTSSSSSSHAAAAATAATAARPSGAATEKKADRRVTALLPPVRQLPLPAAATVAATATATARGERGDRSSTEREDHRYKKTVSESESESENAVSVADGRGIISRDEFGEAMTVREGERERNDGREFEFGGAMFVPPIADAWMIGDAWHQWVQQAGEAAGKVRRFGLPATSWRNKMPFLVPRPPSLARGLQWPEQALPRGASEDERRAYLRCCRRLQPFLLGSGVVPAWSWVAADAWLVWMLVANPQWPWAL